MSVAIAPLTDFNMWLRTNLPQIVLLILGAILLTRFITWLRDQIIANAEARENRAGGTPVAGTDLLVRSEASKHRRAVAQLITWTVLALLYAITSIQVVHRLGVPLASLVGPATLGGVALGFGAQRIVQDIGAGFFIITERQYGFGDLIRLSALGVGQPVTGTVEDVTLRTTRIRTIDGEVVITPNGQIVQVTNLSRDWARAVIDVPVPASVDVHRVSDMLRHVGEQAYADADLRRLLLDAPSVMGVESIGVDLIVLRLVARTQPGRQFDVGRKLRARIATAFLSEGITVPTELQTGRPSGGAT